MRSYISSWQWILRHKGGYRDAQLRDNANMQVLHKIIYCLNSGKMGIEQKRWAFKMSTFDYEYV